ncbi:MULTISPECIES: hypothetical protein [Rhodomicrobium]|uniref:hypothetical protein n=1 Tax=Rhodomicrobium TaxID=1068 RepID=UPI000B4A78E8|nr:MULTISPECIES: hypothetical protein [Rhodomicrobium]
MLKKLSAVAAILVLAATLVVASFDSAEARRGRGAAAFVGGLAVGALALGALSAEANYGDYDEGGQCYRGRPRCHWVPGECFRDRWGDRHCEEGYRECHRPLICE